MPPKNRQRREKEKERKRFARLSSCGKHIYVLYLINEHGDIVAYSSGTLFYWKIHYLCSI